MRACLKIERGDGTPLVYHLTADRPVSLGRSRENVIVLRDEHASRHHAEIAFLNGRWLLRDVEALNGTRLNGRLIQQEAELGPGDAINIGNTCLRFSLEGEENGHEGPAPTKPLKALTHEVAAPEFDTTQLQADEMTALCQFMAGAVGEGDPRALIRRALDTVLHQTNATVTGFLSLDSQDPLPKVVLPELARVDFHLSRKLTQQVLQDGQAVWLGADGGNTPLSDSILSFTDALCLPLRGGGTLLGALHAYKSNTFFKERDLRFGEVVAGYLANSLHVLRARHNLEVENSRLRQLTPAADQLVGESPAMQQLRQLVARAAPRHATVLIEGESGVGKELVALALHRQSRRSDGPLVVVNCAAIAPTLLEAELFGHARGAFTGADRDHPGLFQQADDGTLFLDEVGELSLDCQAKLLRVIEGRGFRPVGGTTEVQADVRILAATHRDLEKEVKDGRFRQDLFFRLKVIHIAVPPLRERADDIPALVEYFLDKLSREVRPLGKVKLTDAAMRRLQAYSWPGNIRELRAVLERALVMSDNDTLDANDLALPSGGTVASGELPTLDLDELETIAIRAALRQTKGNKTQAAKILGISRDTLATKVKAKGIGEGEE